MVAEAAANAAAEAAADDTEDVEPVVGALEGGNGTGVAELLVTGTGAAAVELPAVGKLVESEECGPGMSMQGPTKARYSHYSSKRRERPVIANLTS